MLFALTFGRQPFEGTHTSVMGAIPFPSETEMRRLPYPATVVTLVRYLLVIDATARPTVAEALEKATELGLV